MKRKLLAVLTSAVVLIACVVPSAGAASKNFTDVKEGDWFKDAVESVVDKDLFAGTSETEFSPRAAMTRAMFVQVLANFTENYTKPQTEEIALFTDVKKDAWYYDAVQWAATSGIVAGKGDALFDPQGQITRQEMITMLFNYALKTGEATSFKADALSGFTDRESISDWAETATWWAVSNQIIAGTGNNELSPTATSTRAQVAAMFNNAYGVMTSRETIPLTVNAPDDPDKDYLDLLALSFEELSKAQNLGQGDTSLMPPYTAYTDLKDYPDVTVYITKDTSGAQYIYYIGVPVKELFSNLSGKTAGEVIGTLGASASLNSYESANNTSPSSEPYITPYITYETKNYSYVIRLNKDTLKVDADAVVYISAGANNREVLEIPDDLTVSLTFKGTTICTVELPESYRQCIIYRKELLYDNDEYPEEGGIFFMEPIQELRYGGWMHGGTLFSIRVVEKITMVEPGDEDNGPVVDYEIEQDFELNGETYTLLVAKSTYSYDGTDQEVIDSFKTMRAEIDKIIDGLEINSALKLIG